MGVGGWAKIKIKDHLSPAEAETWTELGKNYAKTIAVSRIMNKPINYPKRTKLPYELGSIENQHYSASLLDPEAIC